MTTILIYLFSFIWITNQHITENGNSIRGHVKIIQSEKSFSLERGSGYEETTEPISEVKKQILLDNHPDKHIIVSLHPLDFIPSYEPSENVAIHQHEKTFIPSVTSITKGSTVYFVNDDEFFHNVYSLTPGARFNIGRRPSGNSYPKKIKKSGVIKLSCDIHSEMRAVLLSFETPYFQKLDEEGNFEFNELPDGKYRLEVFHLDLGVLKREIEVQNGEMNEINLEYSNRA